MAQFSVRPPPPAAIVSASGDIDPSATQSFRRALTEAIAFGSPLTLVDMTKVTFLDSAGLAVLVGVSRTLPLGQEIALCNVPSRMLRALAIAGTARIIPVHADGEPWLWPQIPEPSAQPT